MLDTARMNFAPPLPIDAVLDEVRAALASSLSAVLVAPPGAGKTTRVPLALMNESWLQGRKILVLEPRRIAARAAAERMAHSLSEDVGGKIGLRARMVSKSGPKTRIEVVTEGVFTRMILDDPELSGIGAVLFDEFHERSLDADLGLALALDCQRGLRDDLRILPMSATLDGARVAQLLGGAPVVTSEGRAFPVDTLYLGRHANKRIEDQMVDAVTRALRAESGSILAFLPGQGEIRRVEERLKQRIGDPDVVLAPLYGAMDMNAQDLALEPAPKGLRKVVLATSIAETSITIEGVRVVIDSGLARVPRFEPDVGVTRLETVRVSRAAADQRRGRAGRTEPGVCYRLWDEPQTQSLPAFAEPEIRSADLAGLLLDCAEWGTADPHSLSWIDPPPAAAIEAAREELTELEALDAEGRITPIGKRLRSLPLPPRLARMVVCAAELGHAQEAAEIATVKAAWPDLTDAALANTAPEWLAPCLAGKTRLADIGADDLGAALDALLPWQLKRRLEEGAPTHFEAPTGNRYAIDYETPSTPALHIRVQELFGLTQHPSIAHGKLPLTLHLLSPAHRPIQITRDLPGFWKGSWAAVKAEMKGRYPRHPWPEDPASAAPTARAKPRGS